MPDPTPAANGSPDPKKSRKSPGPIDQKKLDQLDNDQEVIRAAIDEAGKDAALATALASHFLDNAQTVPMTVANLHALDAEAEAARQAAGKAVAKKADFHDVTDDEGDNAQNAIAAIRQVQTAAKEKYEESNPAKLAGYFVGQPLRSRQQITTAGSAIFGLLRTTDEQGNPVAPQDTLPGYNAAKIAALETSLGSYGGIQTTQSAAQKTASDARTEFEAQADQVSRRRRRLQLALDGERPHTNAANAALRKRLGLPDDRSMS